MQATTPTSSAIAPTTPPRPTTDDGMTSSTSPRRLIQSSPGAQHISPLGSSPPRLSLSPSKTQRFRRPGLDATRTPPTEQELQRLFAAARDDNAELVSNNLKGLPDPNVKDPQTGETLVLAAASSGAWKVVALLSSDFAQAVVDEPVNDRRATDVAREHASEFDPVLMSRWHRLLQHIESDEARLSKRIGTGLMSLGLGSAGRSSGGWGETTRLESKEHLMAQLRQLVERVDWLLATTPEEGTNARVFVPLDLGDSATRVRFKAMLKQEQHVLKTLRPALQRWSDFIEQLFDIGRRPLPDPHAGLMSIHNQAMLHQDASTEPLIQSLVRVQAKLNLPPMDAIATAKTTAALHVLMDETNSSKETVRMTMQQVLLAQRYFEELPESLLLDRQSLIRSVDSALRAADEAHGGRPALLEEIHHVIGQSDALLREADALRQQAKATRPKDDDSRPEARTLRRHADELEERAQALSDRIDVDTLANCRTWKLYVELEKHDPIDLELHPRHLMAACLRLARQYTGRRDNADRSMKLFGDSDMVAKILHAERRVLDALDYRLAKYLVIRDEHGQRLPDTRLYRVDADGRQRAPSSPGRRFLSASPRQYFARSMSGDRSGK